MARLGWREGFFIAFVVEVALLFLHSPPRQWAAYTVAENVAYGAGFCTPIPAIFAVGWAVTAWRRHRTKA